MDFTIIVMYTSISFMFIKTTITAFISPLLCDSYDAYHFLSYLYIHSNEVIACLASRHLF